ncbi:MAG: site-specific DNA-methyltransferase [Chloroflexi bacterium]|nr:site-specific DNA-methyltransferase [Chloroflexota bacterium]
MSEINEIMTLKEASDWVKQIFKRDVSPSSISYLVQYGQIRKINGNGETKVFKADLQNYYSSQNQKEIEWKRTLGEDLNWHLSFENVKESERTKHVHRLHPYKGKFIPQLVEYFLDEKTDDFKHQIYFHRGDIVLDPFCGSGTALVQANELGINAIGIDISEYNSLISNVKVNKHDLIDLQKEIRKITLALRSYIYDQGQNKFEEELLAELSKFNQQNFPSPDYVYKVRNGVIEEFSYASQKEQEFLPIFERLVKKYDLQINQKDSHLSFMNKWYLYPVRQEIDFTMDLVEKIQNLDTKDVIKIILSRTVRSCRATTHSDLATLLDPITTTYYCHKHYKICKPLFSIYSWWDYYSRDTIKRLSEFNKLRTTTDQICLSGDSRTINIVEELRKIDPKFACTASHSGINGIFSSPPYVGMIDYHEQHAYAYELFELQRRDNLEIGPMFKGKGSEAKQSYVDGISKVLNNCKQFLTHDYNIFLVANDHYNLYPIIAKKSGMEIVMEFKRPVLNRTEKDKSAYAEKIFHLKDANNGHH